MKHITLFEVPIWKIPVKNWKAKKKQFNILLDHYQEIKKPPAHFYSNRNFTDKKELIIQFYTIFKIELNKISHLIKSNYEVPDLWSSSYEKGDYQNPHNHGSKGYSAIMYFQYCKKNPVTKFVQPWNDELSDQTILKEIDVEEGDILLFPQTILHFSPPNTDRKKKRIVSWDIDPKPWLKK